MKRVNLFDVSRNGTVEEVQSVLTNANINGQTRIGGSSALHLACSTGNVPIVKLLLERGASTSLKDDLGNYALHKAAECVNVAPVLKLLLDHGADVNVCGTSGRTALHLVAACNRKYDSSACIEALLLLIKAGGDVDARVTTAKTTPLHYAVRVQELNVVHVLLNLGAQECRSTVGTQLQTASYRQDLVPILLEFGHSMFIRSPCGHWETPLHSSRGATRWVPNINSTSLLLNHEVTMNRLLV